MKRSGSIKNKVYKFVHEKDETIQTNLTGRPFYSDWLIIEENGKITVRGSYKKGYAWDGCSPKINIIDLICGTPDGRFDYRTEKQMTYYASMFHDALYQYKSHIEISRKEADLVFRIILDRSGFMLTGIYYFFVRLCGGSYGNWKRKTSISRIEILECPWLNINFSNEEQGE